MININDERCSGCGACTSVCPTGCLSLQISKTGEYRPVLDTTKCINCNKCSKVCYLDKEIYAQKIGAAYYGWAIDDNERIQSSSGGLAHVFAEYILEKIGGVVYGAVFTAGFHEVKHIPVKNMRDLEKIQGSKYVESNMTEVYSSVKEELNSGKAVLFVGVPCQIHALKSYLGTKIDNLTCVEVFCHGAPRAGVFHRYIDYLNKKCGKVTGFNFRSKQFGWNDPSYEIEFNNNTSLHQKHKDNVFHLMFGHHNSLRNSCFKCICRGEDRCADISLGDFWGVEKYYPDLDMNKGISAIFINSQKGNELLEAVSDKVTIRPCKREAILEKNTWFLKNYSIPSNQSKFERDYQRLSDSSLFKKYELLYKYLFRIKSRFGRN